MGGIVVNDPAAISLPTSPLGGSSSTSPVQGERLGTGLSPSHVMLVPFALKRTAFKYMRAVHRQLDPVPFAG